MIALLLPIGQTRAQEIIEPGGVIHYFERVTLDTDFFAEGATFGDLNGDGHADLIAGPWWYRGPNFEQRQSFYPPKA
jgi:hypothetical protein